MAQDSGELAGLRNFHESIVADHDLPDDLRRVLRDQSVVVPQDGGVFALIAGWQNAPSNTASADLPPDHFHESIVTDRMERFTANVNEPREEREHESLRLDGTLDNCCLRCGADGYWHHGQRLDVVHPSGKLLFRVTA